MAKLISVLNELAESGLLNRLYQAKACTLTAYNYRDIYLYLQALLTTPRYVDHRAEAVRETARQCGVSRQTVERAVREMEQDV